MKRRDSFYVLILVAAALFVSGCDKKVAGTAVSPDRSGPIDVDGKFEATLVGIDNLLGKRSTAIKMTAAVGGTYKVSGSIDPVVALVDAYAGNAGFTVTKIDPETLKAVLGMKFLKNYAHPMGDNISLTLVEVSARGAASAILTVQLLSPSRAGEQ